VVLEFLDGDRRTYTLAVDLTGTYIQDLAGWHSWSDMCIYTQRGGQKWRS